MTNEIYSDIHSTGLQPARINSFPNMHKDWPQVIFPFWHSLLYNWYKYKI